MRLDNCVAERYGITRSRALALIKQGLVRVNGEARQKAGFEVEEGDAVEAEIPAPAPTSVAAQELPLRVLYQDADLAVVYKPSGMVVHPAAGNPDGTLVNALLCHLDGLSGIGGELRPGIVHRIDKDTSGLLLVAKNDKSHVCLSQQIGAHTVERAYLAIVQGAMKAEEGDIDRPIARHPSDRKRMAIVPGGREAFTHWRVLEPLRGATYIEARLENWAHAPNPGTYGLHRSSGAGRPRVWPKKAALSRGRRPAFARLQDWFCSSLHRRMDVFYRRTRRTLSRLETQTAPRQLSRAARPTEPFASLAIAGIVVPLCEKAKSCAPQEGFTRFLLGRRRRRL